jgi:hypothetical protein
VSFTCLINMSVSHIFRLFCFSCGRSFICISQRSAIWCLGGDSGKEKKRNWREHGLGTFAIDSFLIFRGAQAPMQPLALTCGERRQVHVAMYSLKRLARII